MTCNLIQYFASHQIEVSTQKRVEIFGTCFTETELVDPADLGKRQMTFGSTAGNVGQQGTNSGSVAVGSQWYGKRQMSFGNTAGSVGQQGTNSGNVAVGSQWNGKRQMSFGNTAGNVGQQGINSGSVAVGSQWNGRK